MHGCKVRGLSICANSSDWHTVACTRYLHGALGLVMGHDGTPANGALGGITYRSKGYSRQWQQFFICCGMFLYSMFHVCSFYTEACSWCRQEWQRQEHSFKRKHVWRKVKIYQPPQARIHWPSSIFLHGSKNTLMICAFDYSCINAIFSVSLFSVHKT